MNLSVLAWALAMGTDVGGSATPIGASANVVGTSAGGERTDHMIGWGKYCRSSGSCDNNSSPHIHGDAYLQGIVNRLCIDYVQKGGLPWENR